jgi:hypothetical protein
LKDGNGFGALKLNIGSGDAITMKGYVNVDAKFGDMAFPLQYGDNTVDEIYAGHILEHFGYGQTLDVLKDWTRALKPGGVLKVAVPNFKWIASTYMDVAAGRFAGVGAPPLSGYLMGGQTDEHDFHKAIFDRASLSKLLIDAGLEHIRPWESEVSDCASLPVSLNLMGQKPEGRKFTNPLKAGKNGSAVGQVVTADGNGRADKPHDSRFEAFVNSIEPKNTYSQFGEDGIIEAIFARIGTANKWCVECGAADGLFFSNTRRLIEQGWKSLQIEADDRQYERLYERYKLNPDVIAEHVQVGLGEKSRLDDVIGYFNQIPADFDLLVLDVDGQEYHIVNSLVKFKPRVLIVEYDPDADPMHIPEPGAPRLDQAGRFATRFAVEARGYEVICRTQCNLICVRRDLAHLLVEHTKEAPKADYARMGGQIAQGNVPHNGSKVFAAGQWREVGHKPGQVQLETVQVPPIAIATSTPRYGSLLASDTMWQAALALKAVPCRAGGAWWEMGLTRQIEKFLELETERGKVEFIIAVDFDSYFNPEDGLKLIRLMYENPNLDCIAPMQVRRGTFEEILAQTDGPVNMTDPLVPIVHGHFGFTVFRRRVFDQMSKPWMMNIPDPEGGWNEKRTDADIYFWNKFCNEGFKAAMSTEVVIGHGDEAVCWPRFENGKVVKVWQSIFEWIQTHKPPEGIVQG